MMKPPTLPRAPRKAALRASFVVLLAAMFTLLLPSAVAQTPEPAADPMAQAIESTVFLMQTFEEAGQQVISCVGSGTLIGARGLILTSAHLARASGPCRGERIVVALPIRRDEPPVPTYLAEPVQVDTRFDLAVLQINAGLDDSPINPASLSLPHIDLGESIGLLPGNGLTFVGYEGFGTDSVKAVQGVLTGITAEKNGSEFAWLRTDSELGGGMGGGGAYTPDGGLVGVLTSMPPTTGIAAGQACLNIQDSTGDGLINQLDQCVPQAGSVSSIRPIVFALPLIEAGLNGLTLLHRQSLPAPAGEGAPAIENLFFSTAVSDHGIPGRIVSSLPGGVSSLYLFFDYHDMEPGIPYQITITRDGAEMPQFSLGPLAWGGDRDGTWYFGTDGKTWPDGLYEFTVSLYGTPVASAQIQVGPGFDPQGFSNLRFSTPAGTPGGGASTGTLFPAGLIQIDATFDFEGLLEGQAWTEVWYLEGLEVYNATYLWDRGPQGTTSVSAVNASGLPEGAYRVDLLIGERLAATGAFSLVGTPAQQGLAAAFTNVRLANGITRDGRPDGQVGAAGLAVAVGASRLYCFFDWERMPGSATWTYRWYRDGRLIGSNTQTWQAGAAGQDFWVGLESSGALPEGEYAVELLVESQPMFSANMAIGSGAQPTGATTADTDVVMIGGRVVDALTGESIPGALVIVLDVALESVDFTWNEAQIHTQSLTDREGRFDLPRGLARRNFYTVYVFADEYITILEDNFTIPRDQPSPTEIVIQMVRP